MKKISFFLVLAFVLVSCGGGGGGGGGNSENINSDIFSDALAILNKYTGIRQSHYYYKRNGSAFGVGVGCGEDDTMTEDELYLFVESETAYALCGHQLNEYNNPLCIYPGSDAYRTVEISAATDYPDAQQEIIAIPFQQGQVEVWLSYVNSDYEYRYKAINDAVVCDIDTLPETTAFTELDIDGAYTATIVSIDANGVPVTESIGGITCDSGNCTGIVTISGMQYDSMAESWFGQLTFGGIQYELIATLSPDKSIAVFAAGPFSEAAPQNLSESCLFIGAYRE